MVIERTFRPVSSAEVQQRILRIYDHLYANGTSRTPAGIASQAGKLLHVALFIEEALGRIPAFDFTRLDSKALLGSQAQTREFSALIRAQFGEMNASWNLYAKDDGIDLGDYEIAFACCELSGIAVSDPERDVFGDALEIFRGEWAKRAGGQYFTDQRVTKLAMHLLEFDPRQGDDLVDICAGTGGFLLAGLNHIRELLEHGDARYAGESGVVALAASSLIGQEVDQGVAEIANATLSSRLGSIQHRLVTSVDSLKAGQGSPGLVRDGAHMCAASNPPFGTKITVKDPEILCNYDLSRKDPNARRGPSLFAVDLMARPPDVLFLERNLRILRPGHGRLAIVLPYQLLSGPQALPVRKWLLRHAEIKAVVDLPPETFQPHTGTKTSLVVARRRETPLDDSADAPDAPVFMSLPRWIGHDRRGNPVYRRAADGSMLGDVLSDMEDVVNAFHHFKSGLDPAPKHHQSFVISSNSITRDPMLRLNALFHKPLQHALANPSSKGGSGWTTRRLGDLVESIFFPTRFKRHYVDHFPGAVPFLGGSNICEISITSRKWLRPDDPKLASLRVKAGWLLVTRSGSTGIVSSVPEPWDGFAMSEHVIRIVPDDNKMNRFYLLAALRSAPVQEILARGVFGSVIDEITPEFLLDLEIPVPSDGALVERISETMRSAERARGDAITGIAASVSVLESEVGVAPSLGQASFA